MSEGKDSGKFSIYLEYGKLLDFFKIANSVSYDGRLQFEDSKMSVIEINLNNTAALQLDLEIQNPKTPENWAILLDKKYLVEFKDVLNILFAFCCEPSDLIKCTIDETNSIFVLQPIESIDGYCRRGFAPIHPNPISRRKSLKLVEDFVTKYKEDYTYMQIDVDCAELYSALKPISNMEFHSCNEGVILMGTEKGLTVSSATKENRWLKTSYLSTTIPFDGDQDCLNKDVFIGHKPEKEWVASVFDAQYLLDLLNVLPKKNCMLTVSVSTNCVCMIETKMRGMSLRYGVAPKIGENPSRIIEDAYAMWIMLMD